MTKMSVFTSLITMEMHLLFYFESALRFCDVLISVVPTCGHAAFFQFLPPCEQQFINTHGSTPSEEQVSGQFMMAHSAVSVQPAMVVSTTNTQWSSGVCDCCEDMGICCCGLWCPYCLMCKTSEEFGECLCLPLLEICFGGMLHPITLTMRSSMRERFHIKGSIQDDCCTVFCCTVCVWCQMARELKARRHSLVVINTAVNTVHHQPQAFNQPTQAINTSYQPLNPINPAY